MRALSAVLIGLGKIGLDYDFEYPIDSQLSLTHSNSLFKHDRINFVAAIDSDPRKCRGFENKYGIRSYKCISDVANIVEIDLFVIATPTESHVTTIQKLINHNISKCIILCEKPFSNSSSEAKQMLSICNSRQIKIFVNYMRNCDLGFKSIRSFLQSKKPIESCSGFLIYSGGFINNCSHYIFMLSKLLGSYHEYSILSDNPTKIIKIIFEHGEVIFLPVDVTEYSIMTLELFGIDYRIDYDNSGWDVSIYDYSDTSLFMSPTMRLNRSKQRIQSSMDSYQLNVYDELFNYLDTNDSDLCKGDEAVKMLEFLESIFS